MTGGPYEVIVTAEAQKTLGRLPRKHIDACLQYLNTLGGNPRRVGKQLSGQLAGLHSARVSKELRVVYLIDEEHSVVQVLRFSHRGNVYRPR